MLNIEPENVVELIDVGNKELSENFMKLRYKIVPHLTKLT